MKHDIHIAGYAYKLRPVELEDAGFIVEVRTPERSRFMHPIERTVEAQRKFLLDYFQRPKDYYFVVERIKDKRREGLTGLTDFDSVRRSVQWGRIILRPDSLASAETALLVLRLVFEIFELREVWGIALPENKRMLAYVESLGFEHQGIVPILINGEMHDAVKSVLTKERWRDFEEKVSEIARAIVR